MKTMSFLFSLLILFPTLALAAKSSLNLDDFHKARSRENVGYRNGLFTKDTDYIDSKFQTGDDPTAIDPKLFVGSRRILSARAVLSADTGPSMKSGFGKQISIMSFAVFRDEIYNTLKASYGFSEEQAAALANEMERQSVEEARLNYSQYAKLMERKIFSRLEIATQALAGTNHLNKISQVLTGCDVPFVAGYDIDDKNIVYIDRSVPVNKNIGGKKAPLHRLLTFHERIEKTFLDKYQTIYPHAHQIAIRMEKLAAVALGISWPKYDAYWESAQTNMAEIPTKVSRRLDMTPYFSFLDNDNFEIVENMLRNQVDESLCRP